MAFNSEQKRAWYQSNSVKIRTRRMTRMHAAKVAFVHYKGDMCSVCGVEYDGTNACIFQFHHINPNEKEYQIGGSMSGDIESFYPELDKCVMVCSNCHWKIHSEEY